MKLHSKWLVPSVPAAFALGLAGFIVPDLAQAGMPPEPVCGNNFLEAGEECDGTDDAVCPGQCQADCTCLPAAGGSLEDLQLVGFTSATFTGDQGVLGFTLACQVDFPASRMCNSVEVMETVIIPAGLTGTAWVRPVIEAAAASMFLVDASGIFTSGSNSCIGWSVAGDTGGLFVSSTGQFATPGRACAVARAVACCALVP